MRLAAYAYRGLISAAPPLLYYVIERHATLLYVCHLDAFRFVYWLSAAALLLPPVYYAIAASFRCRPLSSLASSMLSAACRS